MKEKGQWRLVHSTSCNWSRIRKLKRRWYSPYGNKSGGSEFRTALPLLFHLSREFRFISFSVFTHLVVAWLLLLSIHTVPRCCRRKKRTSVKSEHQIILSFNLLLLFGSNSLSSCHVHARTHSRPTTSASPFLFVKPCTHFISPACLTFTTESPSSIQRKWKDLKTVLRSHKFCKKQRKKHLHLAILLFWLWTQLWS